MQRNWLVIFLCVYLQGVMAADLTSTITEASFKYSRYGNPKSYVVEGKHYDVLRTSSGYRTKGVASWYGEAFHHRPTASGVIYDMFEMTAAHKTLPLPSYVRVTNLSNGRKVIVKINDRGPFYKDRVIDLSYAAAKKLGFLQQGITEVEVETLDAGRPPASYFIQAGAFKSKDKAEKLKQQIEKMSAWEVDLEVVNDYYIVTLGPFDNDDPITRLKSQLKNEGLPPPIVYLR